MNPITHGAFGHRGLPRAAPAAPPRLAAADFHDLKARLHDRLVGLMDLAVLEALPHDSIRSELARLLDRLLPEEAAGHSIGAPERERLVHELQDEMFGFGPLEPHFRDPTVSDIHVNTFEQVYVERFGVIEETPSRFHDDQHLRRIMDRILSSAGCRLDDSSPVVDVRLPDGSRVNAVIPPIAVGGPSLTIRRFSADPPELQDLIHFNTLTAEMGEVLRALVKARSNILVSGPSGSGKTTALNVLARFIPPTERIVTIEEAAELRLPQRHVVRLESRPSDGRGLSGVTMRDLVRNALRMRPRRLLVGEVRGAECLELLQAMNTGHDGSLATIHAESPADALRRLETLAVMAGLGVAGVSLRRYVSSAVSVIVQMARLADGARRVVSLQEVAGVEGEEYLLTEVFAFEETGVDEGGKIRGRFRATGVKPRFAERCEARGAPIPLHVFDPLRAVEL